MLISQNHRPQRGNVLFLILIAVALFAALSFAITQTSRGTNDIGKDKIQLLASQIIQIGTSVEQAVARIQLANKVKDYEIDFSAVDISAAATNNTCQTERCRVFSSEGGITPAILLPAEAWDLNDSNMTSVWQGRKYFYVGRVLEVGSTLPELFVAYPGIAPSVCAEINRKLGIANTSNEEPPFDDNTNTVEYTGTLTSLPTPSAVAFGDQATQLTGKRTFCVRFDANSYMYVHVLLAR
jgi:4-amino-4-deoxy-L-arabinose transferase-like glycosyltransferase